jgi:hypothetical protein
MRTSLVARFEVSNGETVWITEHQEPLSPGMKSNISQRRDEIDILVREHAGQVDWATIDPFAVVFGTHENGTRTFLEIATTPEVVGSLRRAALANVLDQTNSELSP